MARGRRRRIGGNLYHRDVIREALRRLKSGHVLWYGVDQDYGRKHSVFVPFMAVREAATLTATSRWARLTGAAVLPFFADYVGSGYRIRILPPLDNFPSDDDKADATRINQILEQEIRRVPQNYLWTHRRFKTRPNGEERPY